MHRDRLFSNSYNPNKVAPPEMRLLVQSILEDGWCSPIIVFPANEDGMHQIVDGFHRWTVSGVPEVYAMTNGYVPVVDTNNTDLVAQRLTTIRLNRARGSHGVVPMGDIVNDLLDNELSVDDLGKRLGMHREEVERFRLRGDIGRQLRAEEEKAGESHELSQAWEPWDGRNSEESQIE